MKIGMYTYELRRGALDALFEAARGYGYEAAQFSFTSTGGVELPDEIPPGLARRIREAADRGGIEIAAVNGTFNMIEPDRAARRRYLRSFEQIAAACGALGAPVITLCTGSRNPESMWRWHDLNLSEAAWADLVETARALVAIAERYDVTLGVEPEASNIVNTPERARRLLDEIASPRLKIVLDPANLFLPGEARPENARRTLDRAFALLGGDIALAHGKDILAGDGLSFTAAGRGIVDFEYFIGLLAAHGYAGPIILHGIKDEALFEGCAAYVRDRLPR